MTVVLPAPVASFSARRSSSGFAFVGPLDMGPELGHPQCHFWRDLGQPDRGLDSFDLAEKGTDALELMVPPMLRMEN
jgi:hypothetical protein